MQQSCFPRPEPLLHMYRLGRILHVRTKVRTFRSGAVPTLLIRRTPEFGIRASLSNYHVPPYSASSHECGGLRYSEVPYWGPHYKGFPTMWGSILWVPYFRKVLQQHAPHPSRNHSPGYKGFLKLGVPCWGPDYEGILFS